MHQLPTHGSDMLAEAKPEKQRASRRRHSAFEVEDTDSPGPWPFDVDKKSEDQPILQNTDSTSDDSPPELEDTFNRGDHPTAYSSSTYLTDTIGKTNTPSTNAGAPALRPVEGPRCRDVQDINMDSPGKELQHKLLRHYVDWIHPQLPFLDIQAIVETITTTAAIHPHGMSSLLLYAILFAGSLYSEDQDFSSTSYGLKSCGQSRLWRKAKILYHECQNYGSLDSAQAALLLSLQRGTDPTSLENATVWLSRSISTVQGLITSQDHKTPSVNTDPQPGGCQIDYDADLTRLAWAIRMRELTLTIGFGQTPSLAMGVIESATPTFPTLDPCKLSKKAGEIMSPCLLLRPPKQQTILATLYSERLRLSQLIGSAVSNPESFFQSKSTSSATKRPVRCLGLELQRCPTAVLLSFEKFLCQWWYSLPTWMRHPTPSDSRGSLCMKRSRLISFHLAVLAVTFLSLSTTNVEARLSRELSLGEFSSPTAIAILEDEKKLNIKKNLNILEFASSEDLPHLLVATGPMSIRMSLSALLQADGSSSGSHNGRKVLELIRNCVDYLFTRSADSSENCTLTSYKLEERYRLAQEQREDLNDAIVQDQELLSMHASISSTESLKDFDNSDVYQKPKELSDSKNGSVWVSQLTSESLVLGSTKTVLPETMHRMNLERCAPVSPTDGEGLSQSPAYDWWVDFDADLEGPS